MCFLLICLGSGLAAQNPLDSIWVSNSANNTLMKIDRATQTVVLTVTTPAGRPVGVTVRDNGDVWVAIQNLAQVFAVDTNGKVIGTFAAASRPTGMGTDLPGNVWCGVLSGSFIRYTKTGVATTITPTGCTSSQNISCDSRGNVWLGDGGSGGKVFKMSPSGAVLLTVAAGVSHRTPAVDHDDNVFTTGFGSTTLSKWSNSGTNLGTFSHGISTQQGLAVDADNNVWLANQTTNILKFSNSGKPLGTFSTGGSSLLAVGVDGLNNIWVSNYGSASMTVMKTDGTVIKTIPVGSSPIPIGDNTGFQRAVFTDPFGDVDADGHRNNAEAVGGSNPFDPRSVPCSLVVGGDQKVGGKATLDYADLSANAGGQAYVMACALSTTFPIPIGKKRRIDLTLDGLLFLSLTQPSLFQKFIGSLDSSGKATGTILIPSSPALAGTTIYCAALTWDLLARDGVRNIAPTMPFKIKP